MAKVKVGDLVCLFRRKKKGLGIVLEHVPDIIEQAGAGASFEEVMETLSALRGGSYLTASQYRFELKQKAERPELIDYCLSCNTNWASRPKKEFVRIRWFESPSFYEVDEPPTGEEWVPIEWVRQIS